MPIHRSVLKRARQAAKRRSRNIATKSRIKTFTKRVLEQQDKESAKKALKELYSVIDKAVKKGVLHRNTAGRKKSRIAKRVNALP